MIGWLKKKLLLRTIKNFLESLNREGKLNVLKAFFGGSKKATAVLVGIIAVLAREVLGLDDATIAKIVQLIMAYVVGQGVADAGIAISGKIK